MDAAQLRQILKYDPATGLFQWRASRGSLAPAGAPAGSKTVHGYWTIRVNKHPYYAHRLAFLYMTGEWPTAQVDHANRDRCDNRWANLRAASHSENVWNRGRLATNKSGFKGVSWRAKIKRWRAQICVDGKIRELGRFRTAEAAHEAYCVAAQEAFGQFARTE